MIYSVSLPNAQHPVPFQECRSDHPPPSRPLSLALGLMTGLSLSSHPHPTPYPSPPMSGSPPPTFPQTHNSDSLSRQDIQQPNAIESTHQSYRSSEFSAGSISPIAAVDHRISHPSHGLAITTQVGRSPFMALSTPVPSQPQRRTKSHVASACVNCKKAHLACDVRRPCPRCIGLNKQDTCRDVQHKKRGRPRLRDGGAHSFEIGQMGSIVAHPDLSSPLSSPTAQRSPYRGSPHRVLKAQASDTYSRVGRPYTAYGMRSPPAPSQVPRYFDERSARGTHVGPPSDLQAFLTLELVIAWSTERLRDFLGYQDRELNCVKTLFDIVSPEDRERLYRLSRQIQDEVSNREPTYRSLPSTALYTRVKDAPLAEVLNSVTNHRTVDETLEVRLPNGQRYRTGARIRLVQYGMFFVVLELTSIVEASTPSQPTAVSPAQYGPPQQFAPAQQYGSVPSQISIPPSNSPRQMYRGDAPPSAPLSPYSLYPIRGLPSPVDSRPRSLHDATYPSLAQYANSSPSSGTAPQSFGRIPISPNNAHSTLNFRRHSDQPLPSSSLKLPPIRSPETSFCIQAPNQARSEFRASEPVRKLSKRIAVEDVLQSIP